MKSCLSKMIKIMIFAFLFDGCLSLQCFSCSSQIELANGMKNECDYFSYLDRTKISDCTYPNVCAKYLVEHDGVKWVHRSCRHFDICREVAIKYNNNRNALIDCTTCSDTDLCNSSSNTKYSVILIVLGLMSLCRIYKY